MLSRRQRPEPIVTRALRFGVSGRTLFDGTIVSPLSAGGFDGQIRQIPRNVSGAESFAICLLHSYANPRSEETYRARDRSPSAVHYRKSHRILAEYREFERLSTTVINAYVAPKMSRASQDPRKPTGAVRSCA